MISSKLAPEIRRKGMWCHLFGLSSALWIFAWIVAVRTTGICVFPHLSPFLVIAIGQKTLQTVWVQSVVNAFFCWIISLLMLLVGPSVTLVNWLQKRNFHPFVNAQGKESFNFQLSVSICVLLVQFFFNLFIFRTEQQPINAFGIPSTVLVTMVMLITLAFFPLLTVFQAILVISAASKAAKGQSYRYPFTIRFFK